MTLPALRSRDTLVLTIGFVAGLVLRVSMLFYMGTDDMNAYHEWGQAALESGLPSTFHGIYFPFQYQIFMVSAWLTNTLGTSFVPVFKSANLVFDAGTFFLVVLLLRRQHSSPRYALVYWLHPWLLSVFSLGYVDFQFAFFVLLCVVLLRDGTAKAYFLSGIPLGLAFLMKPQAQVLIVCAFSYAAFHYVRTRDARPFGLLAFPVALFAVYEAYFTVALFGTMSYRAAVFLPENYQNVTNALPCLTADMLNLWYPIAYALKLPGDPIHSVSDQMEPFLGIPVKHMAGAVVVWLVVLSASQMQRRNSESVSDRFVSLFGFASLAVPFVMTSAHENHLFLGSLFLILLMARGFSLPFQLAGHLLLVVQFLNIYGLYGEHPVGIARLLRGVYSQEAALVYALVSVPCFVWVLGQILRQPAPRSV